MRTILEQGFKLHHYKTILLYRFRKNTLQLIKTTEDSIIHNLKVQAYRLICIKVALY